MKTSFIRLAVIAVFGSSLLLSACGQKGALYLPDDNQKKEEKKDAK